MRTSEERRVAIEERKRRPKETESAKLWVRDRWEQMAVWEVPVDALLLNAENRRFRAERMWAEEELGRALDPSVNPDDARSVEALLLDKSLRLEGGRIVGSPSSDTEALKNDFLRRGQETPLWIRPDGTVRNGNRRLAMIRRLQRQGGDQGLQWVDAVILDHSEVDEGALLEMEQREQLTENFKVRYNDIDYLLALKEAAQHRNIDWFDKDSIDEVAGELQTMVEKTDREVIRDLYAIKYMDQFLIDAGQEGQYQRLMRQLERFRDIGRMMIRVEESYPLEADRVLQVLFAAVRAGKPHGDIRSIRKMFRNDRTRFDELAQEIEDAESEWQDTEGPRLGSGNQPGSPAVEEDDDDDEMDDESGPDVPNYPKSVVSSAIEVAIDGFETSKQEDALHILKEIKNRFEVLLNRGILADAVLGAEGEYLADLNSYANEIMAHCEELVATVND